MPELPEVARYRRVYDSAAAGQTIADIAIQDAQVIEGLSVRKFSDQLRGQRLRQSHRHGKHLLIATDGPHIVLHFGMTGELRTESGDRPSSDSAAGGERSKADRVIWHLDDGSRLVFVCPRKLGRVELSSSPGQFAHDKQLGPDALSKDLTRAELHRRLSHHHAAIKSVLMNQSVVAGLGNLYSDEVLFQLGVHPATPVGEVSQQPWQRLFRVMRRVLRTAVRHGGHSDDFPQGYLLKARDDGAPCPRCGHALASTTVGGRQAIFCPNCQPPPS